MNNTQILKRPKPTDDEEELFRMQDEFLKNKQQSSAKVINLRGSTKSFATVGSSQAPGSLPSTAKVRSRFSLQKKSTQNRVLTSEACGDSINPSVKEEVTKNLKAGVQDSVQCVPIVSSNIILGNIIEKKYDIHDFTKKDAFCCSDKGFPEVFVAKQKKSEGNESLFWKHVKAKENIINEAGYTELECNNDGEDITEEPIAMQVHKENLEILRQMNQKNIIMEKNMLEMTMKPDLLQFLKDRKKEKVKHSPFPSQNKHKKIISSKKPPLEEYLETYSSLHPKVDYDDDDDNTPMVVEESIESIPKPPIELMEQAKEKGWVHMDSLEPEKLKWMEDISSQKDNELAPNEPYNARFDFNGLLLPYKDESVPVEKGLHHHGEEPERPGYSLEELLLLSFSSVQQQRCIALHTLSNIIEKCRKGWYDKVLQPTPLTVLSQRNLVLLLRFAMDDSSMAVVSSALQTLRAFLYNETDELCLDRMYGFHDYKEPTLSAPKTDVTDTSNLKDHELAQLDTVAALLRTDIPLRIRYILSELQPPTIVVTCALEILIRLTRHSAATALHIANTPYLLCTIIEHFMPLSTNSLAMQDAINSENGNPVVTAVKFCRILVCYGGKCVAQKLDKLKIMQRIISYISSDAGIQSFTLSVESLRLWRILLLHKIAEDSLTGAQLTLYFQLDSLLSDYDILHSRESSCGYGAYLVSVASCLEPLKANISVLLSKWNEKLRGLSNVTYGNLKLIAETLLAVSADASTVKKLKISGSHVFLKLWSASNLLSGCTIATEREPSCLPQLGAFTHGGQLQPILCRESCIPFLATVLHVFVNNCFVEEIQAILHIPQLVKYLKRLETTDWSLERSWYTRPEFSFLVALVKAATIVKDKIDNEMAHIIWKIAIKLISSLPADCPSNVKYMLKTALSKEKLNSGIITNKLELCNLDTNIEGIKLNLAPDVAGLYEKYVPSNGEWDQAALPKDWLYLPVVHVYTKCRNGTTCNDTDKTAVLSALSLELVLPDLVEKLSQSLRFTRLVLVYLCDTLFLNADVSSLLTRAISSLIQNHYRKLNFTIDLPGLNSFTDLFTVMCEHFSSTSYGDYGFSMALLIPIAQRHDVHYRKLLWSEHAGLLRYLSLPVDKLVVPLKEYLYPLEEDTSLIESYVTALVRGTVKESWCPIPYAIALHHSAMYLKQSTKLAVKMRTQMQKIPNQGLAALLLHYEPPSV